MEKFSDKYVTEELGLLPHSVLGVVGDIKKINKVLKDNGVEITGEGTDMARVRVPEELARKISDNTIPDSDYTNGYYEDYRPGALWNIHADKTALAIKILKFEANSYLVQEVK